MRHRRSTVRGASVQRITDAPVPLTVDIATRQRRYLITMSFRMLCFVLAIVTHGWLRWSLVVGAIIIPWLAVLAANAGRERPTPRGDDVPQPPMLAPGITHDEEESDDD